MTGTIERNERTLLLIAAAFVAFSLAALALAPAARAANWQAIAAPRTDVVLLAAIWLLATAVGHGWLARTLPHRDPLLFPAAMLLGGWGLVMVARLAPAFGLRQGLWVAIGVLAMLVVATLPQMLWWLRRYHYVWLAIALLLTLATFLFGVNPSGIGPRLWLGGAFGVVRVYFQPAELLKLLMVVFLAAYLHQTHDLIGDGPLDRPVIRYLGPVVLLWGFSLAILFFQRDLGAGSLLLTVFLVMLYFATGNWRYPLAGLLLLILGGAVLYAAFDVVQVRVNGWLNPWADPQGDSFQIVQSLMALAGGGLFGRGLGLGAPTVVPVVHSDFVYAAIVEEWGLFGGLAALLLLAVIVMRALRTAGLTQSRFQALLGVGLAALLGLQVVFIIGGVVKALPLTGITLPYLSYGGSALLINFVTLGLLLRLSHETGRQSHIG